MFFNLPLKHECKVCIADISVLSSQKENIIRLLCLFSFVSSSHHLVFALCRVLSDIHSSRSSPFYADENIQIHRKVQITKTYKSKNTKIFNNFVLHDTGSSLSGRLCHAEWWLCTFLVAKGFQPTDFADDGLVKQPGYLSISFLYIPKRYIFVAEGNIICWWEKSAG